MCAAWRRRCSPLPSLALVGVEGYEGTIGEDRTPARIGAVDAFLDRLRDAAERLDADGGFARADEIIVSAGGSALFDRVVARLAIPAALSRPVRVLLRSGCYVTHDHGLYARVSPLGRASGAAGFRPALELWCEILSTPEPGLAIAGFGRRDASFDAGLPTVQRVVRREGSRAPGADTDAVTVVDLHDQHAFVRDATSTLEVGDLLACGISHPCTAFDKWSLLPLVDDAYNVTGAIRTLF